MAETPFLNDKKESGCGAAPISNSSDDITDAAIRDILHVETKRAAETALQNARQTIERSRDVTSQADQLLARR